MTWCIRASRIASRCRPPDVRRASEQARRSASAIRSTRACSTTMTSAWSSQRRAWRTISEIRPSGMPARARLPPIQSERAPCALESLTAQQLADLRSFEGNAQGFWIPRRPRRLRHRWPPSMGELGAARKRRRDPAPRDRGGGAPGDGAARRGSAIPRASHARGRRRGARYPRVRHT